MPKMTPMRAIRAKCMDCSNGSTNEVTLCPVLDCPLYVYRSGKNPTRAGLGGKGNAATLKKWQDEQAKTVSTP